MNLYYSETLDIETLDGVHFLKDNIGTNHSDPWNDFGYVVMFKVYYVNNNEKKFLGYNRILVKDIDKTADFFKTNYDEKIEDNVYLINSLFDSMKLVSLALKIDFYKILHSLFKEESIVILKLICDGSYYQEYLEEYQKWTGFNSSMLRNSSSSMYILDNAYLIAQGNYKPKNEFSINIDCKSDYIEPISLLFSNERKISRSNINLLIGNNGVGKTTILEELVNNITGIKKFDEPWPFFNKLIVVAFSPFENFYTKNSLLEKIDEKMNYTKNDKEKIRKRRILMNTREYSYIGFKNEDNIFDLNYPKVNRLKSILKILAYDKENGWWITKKRMVSLLETLSLSIDFNEIRFYTKNKDFISVKFKKEDNQIITLNEVLPFEEKDIDLKKGVDFLSNDVPLTLSSGQMIYSFIIPAVVAEIEEESLIILDEPELYLHPTLEIGLINMLKYLLNDTKSYAVIATHSAIMAREIDKNAISILRKDEGISKYSPPTFETYGESLDRIIAKVFDENKKEKPYEIDLDNFFEENKNDKSKEEILKEISKYIGDDALIYLLSKVNNG